MSAWWRSTSCKCSLAQHVVCCQREHACASIMSFAWCRTPPLQFLHELTVHGYMYTYALCYDTRHIMHALALPQPNPHQPLRLKDNCMELVGVIFWLCLFPWFAFFVFLAFVNAAWPRASRKVSFGKLQVIKIIRGSKLIPPYLKIITNRMVFDCLKFCRFSSCRSSR